MSSLVLLGLVVVIVAAFLVFATKKRWVSWKDSGISMLTAFHDFQSKDKQHAIEIVMEQKAGKKLEEQESGQDKNGKPKFQSPNLCAKGASASGGKSGRD
jgi:Co/Zn/Cd efflux system component